MGPDTEYVVTDWNPWKRQTRAAYTGDNPYADGSWSGPEFLEPAQINLSVHAVGNTPDHWWELQTALMDALRPIRTEPVEAEVHWRNGSQDFMMFARPRVLDPEVKNMNTGDVTSVCSLQALDPAIYSSEEFSVTVGVLTRSGGLVTPFYTPFTIHTTVIDGEAEIFNGGSATAYLRIRIDGPVTDPTVTVVTPDGAMSMSFDVELSEGEWLDIDTKEQSVILNGSVSRLNQMSGTWVYIPANTTVTIRFNAPDSPDAQMTAYWRWTY